MAAEQSLMEAGLDSLGALELRNQLATRFSQDLPATLIFDYASAEGIAGFLVGQMVSFKQTDDREVDRYAQVSALSAPSIDAIQQAVSGLVTSTAGLTLEPNQVLW